MAIEVKRLDATLTNDFYALHGKAPFEWCHCVAWEVPVWEGWNDRSAVENLVLREGIFASGRFDGYLLYVDGRPVGWCQCGPRDTWPKLARQYALPPSPDTYAVTCFCIQPQFRRQGNARALLDAVLADLRQRRVRRVEAFPRPGQHADGEVWTGPMGLFLRSGFRVERDDPQRPVMAIELDPARR
jgi:ribosomal protein S18 acetylase RimI-like enzyme